MKRELGWNWMVLKWVLPCHNEQISENSPTEKPVKMECLHLCVDNDDLSVNQVLHSAPQCKAIIHRVPRDLMEVAEKIRAVPPWELVRRWENLGEPEERRHLREDGTSSSTSGVKRR